MQTKTSNLQKVRVENLYCHELADLQQVIKELVINHKMDKDSVSSSTYVDKEELWEIYLTCAGVYNALSEAVDNANL